MQSYFEVDVALLWKMRMTSTVVQLSASATEVSSFFSPDFL